MEISRNTKRITIRPSNSTPGCTSQKNPTTLIQKDTCSSMFTAALFTITKIWKQSKYPSKDAWIKRMWCIYTTYIYYYNIYCCCCWVASVVSDSVWLHRWRPTRLRRPWDSAGKNTGVGCHFLLQCMHACYVASIVSNSVRHYGQQPNRLLHPQDSPSKKTGVGCHFLLQQYILLSHKKEWNSAICSNKERMDLDAIMLSEIKSEKDKYCMISLTCVI